MRFMRHTSTFIIVLLTGLFILYLSPSYVLPITTENIQKLHTLTREDPLFYDPLMDVDFLRESVAEMSHADDLILYVDALYRPSGPEEERGVFPEGWRLWPDEFLGVLPDIHEVTTDFLETPTAEKAEVLLSLYDDAATKYKKAIDLHIEALETTFERDPKKRTAIIAFLGSGTTPEIVYNDFLLIQKNAEALNEEIAQRKKCLYRGECVIENLKLKIENSAQSAVMIPYDPLPPEILGLEGELGKDYFGPYWAETGCFGRTNDGQQQLLPFYIKKLASKSKTEPYLLPVLTNNQYYRDFSINPDMETAITTLNAEYGITLRVRNATSDYMCIDLTYLPNLITHYLYDRSDLEKRLSKNNKLATLPYLMRNTLRASFPLIYYPQYTTQGQNPIQFLTTRSAFSLYFGTFSPTVWLLEKKPKFLLAKTFDPKSGYVKYKDLIARGFAPEELMKLNDIPLSKQLYRDELHTP